MLRSMIDNNAILSKCQWLSFKCNLQKAKFPLALPLSKGARFIRNLVTLSKSYLFMDEIRTYSSVPNRRPVLNKRPGGKFIQI